MMMAKEESLSSGTQHWSRVTCPITHLDTARAPAVMGPHVSSRSSEIVLTCRKEWVKVGSLLSNNIR